MTTSRGLLLIGALAVMSTAQAQITGLSTPGMAVYDSLFPKLLKKWNIPGCAVAVVKNGRLVLAKGYGVADSGMQAAVQPYSRFRMCSLSKATTSMAILGLVQKGMLQLDDKVFTILDGFTPYSPSTVDPRMKNITVRNLLQHTGGWDRAISSDPMFMSIEIANATGTPIPANDTTIIRYMMGRTLDHDPGTRYAYSNYGYMLLGRIIERLTGLGYEDFMKHVFAQAGISRITQGRSLSTLPDEVHYYDYPGSGLSWNVFTGEPNSVPTPYGGFNLEANDADGGWIASPIDYLRFVDVVDGRTPPADILKSSTIDTMVSRPAAPINQPSDVVWYGMGWLVRQAGTTQNWWHDGALPGTMTYMVRVGQLGPYAWAAFFNSRPIDDGGFEKSVDSVLWVSQSGVTSWPSFDLFAPLPQSPVDNATMTATLPLLRWYYPDRSDSFHVQVSRTADFTQLAIDDSSVADMQLVAAGLTTNTRYYWRVGSQNPAGVGNQWSPAWQFVTGATGVAEPEGLAVLVAHVYPDPVHSHMTIEYALPEVAAGRITVVNLLGQTVYTAPTPSTVGAHAMLIDCEKLESGIYTYTVESGKNAVRGSVRIVH